MLEHGGQQAGRGRKAAGESGNRGEGRALWSGRSCRGARRRRGAGGPDGREHAARGVMVGALWSKDARSGWEAAPITCPPATRRGDLRRHRLQRGVGPHCESGVSDSVKAFCGRETGSPAVTRGVAASLLPPSPSHPFGSSNVGPKSPGPTTTNRRHRFRDVSVGAGVGESTRCSSRGSSRLDLAPSGHRARWHKQPHAERGLDQSVTGLGEEGGRLDKTIV